MTTLRFERRTTLPDVGSLTTSTLYMVRDPNSTDHLEMYVTGNNTSELRRLPTRSDILTMIGEEIGITNFVQVTSNIASRDALSPVKNILVLVLDATADSTVDNGAAMYVYEAATSTWHKVSEFESLDVVLDWSNIQNKPTSNVVDIDDAVSKRHAHVNMSVLDKLGENSDGLTFNGSNIRAYIDQNEW